MRYIANKGFTHFTHPHPLRDIAGDQYRHLVTRWHATNRERLVVAVQAVEFNLALAVCTVQEFAELRRANQVIDALPAITFGVHVQ